MYNEKTICFVVLISAVLLSGCCAFRRTPASIQADIKRLTSDNIRLKAENDIAKERLNRIEESVDIYSKRIEAVSGESLTGLDKLEANNIWLGNFISGLIEQLQDGDKHTGE